MSRSAPTFPADTERDSDSDRVIGSAGEPLAKRVVSVVDARTRPDSPTVARSSVAITLRNMKHVRARDVGGAIDHARDRGDIVQLRRSSDGRTVLAYPTPEAYRQHFGDQLTAARVRDLAASEASGRGRKPIVGALNSLLAEVRDGE